MIETLPQVVNDVVYWHEQKGITSTQPPQENYDYLHRLEQLRIVEIGQNAQVWFVHDIHGDESTAPNVWKERIAPTLTLSRFETQRASPLAHQLNRRGYVSPVSLEEISNMSVQDAGSLVVMTNGWGLDEITHAPTMEIANAAREDIKSLNPNYKAGLDYQVYLDRITQLVQRGETEKAQKILNWIRPILGQLASGIDFYDKPGTFYVGQMRDPNRTFTISGDEKCWDDVYQSVRDPQSQLLLKAAQNHPQIRWIVSLHMDKDHGHKRVKHQFGEDGAYLYYTVADTRTDHYKKLVDHHFAQFTKLALAHGSSFFHGTDNPDDPALGLFCDRGLIYQGNINQDGIRKTDNSFEAGMTGLRELGLANIDGVFCLEVPMGYSFKQQQLFLRDFTQGFLLPFLSDVGIAQ